MSKFQNEAKTKSGSYSTTFNSETKCLLNSLPNNKILDCSNLKAFADDKMKVLKMITFVFDWTFLFDRIENIVGKGEMLVTSIFSFSVNVFKRVVTQGR